MEKVMTTAEWPLKREMRTTSAPSTDGAASTVASPHAGTAEFTDTIAFRSPVLELDEAHRERERILPPAAGGPAGAPYKMLRTQVLRRLDQLGANTLAVLSPMSGAGKTLSAINLAIAIAAESNRTALLVDFDFRQPSIHRRFGIDPELGVDDCIEQRRPVQEAMVKIRGYDRLTLLPARQRNEHSSELLSSQRVAELVSELRARYANRILIFDLPPVLQADDALAFTRYVQAGLLVVNEGHTRRDDVMRSLTLLQDLKIVGTVLNGSRNAIDAYY